MLQKGSRLHPFCTPQVDSTTSNAKERLGGSHEYKFDALGTTEGSISTSDSRNLWLYMLLKAVAPPYEGMVQPSSKSSAAASAMISTSPETATPNWP